jgi:hypothetical protein
MIISHILSMTLQTLSIFLLATFPFMTYLSGAKLSFALYSAAMTKSVLGVSIHVPSFLEYNAFLQLKP